MPAREYENGNMVVARLPPQTRDQQIAELGPSGFLDIEREEQLTEYREACRVELDQNLILDKDPNN